MSTGRRPNEDRGVPLRQAPAKFCPRKLMIDGPNVKRYMSHPAALFGYMLACPACGFIEMHTHEKVGFIEADGVLTATAHPARCLYCARTISIAGGVILAVSHG